jgi:signal recognition particle subunit SRP54
MGMGDITEEQKEQIEREMKRTEAIIDSMTKQERQQYKVIDASRKRRIAFGSGTTIAEVNQLLKQYEGMRKMMRQFSGMGLFGSGGGIGGKMMNRVGKMFGMPDMSGMGDYGDDDDYGSGGSMPQFPMPSGKKFKKKKKKRRK